MRMKTVTSIALIALTLFFMTGCGETSNFLGTTDEETIETVTKTEISIPIEKVRTLNPVLSKDEDAYYINKLIYDGLFVLDETLTPVGALVDSYEYGIDGTSLTLHLRNDVLWQDGVSFRANDVKFSIEAYLSAESSGGSMYSPFIKIIRSVKVIDDTTLILTFQKSNEVAIENLTFPILPSHKFNQPKDVQQLRSEFLPVGTGSYMVHSIEAGKSITLSGNLEYRGEIPQNTLKLTIIPGKEEAVNLFEIGEINLSLLKDMDRNTLLNDKEVKMTSFPSNEVEVLGFNFAHEALKDRRVRQAIAYAIDREAIIETCYYNSGVMNDTIYYPNYLGVPSSKPIFLKNTTKAKELLIEASIEELSLSLLVNGEDHARNLAAKIVKDSLEKIGISVSLMPLNWEDYNVAMTKGEYDFFLGGFQIKDTYDVRPILHSAYHNPIKYRDIRIDNLLDRMQSAISIEEKREAFEQIHDILVVDIPYLCLLYKTYGLATPVALQGEVIPYFHNIYHGAENWSLPYDIVEKTQNTP